LRADGVPVARSSSAADALHDEPLTAGLVSGDVASVAERFHSIASTILGVRDLPVDPWFYTYCGPNAERLGATTYVRHQMDLLDLAGVSPRDAVVIDAGCGFGFVMIVHALLGAQHVLGIEVHAGMVSTIEAYLPLLPLEISSRLAVERASVAAMPVDDTSADIVLSIEAISHYLDVDAFIDEAWRVLRPNGVLVIADGNNAANPLLRRRAIDLWEAFELGPEGREEHGHVVGVPYVVRRERMLADNLADLPASARDELARRTAGFTDAQVLAAGRAYVDDGVLPDSPYRRGQLAIAPDGQAMERLFVPHKLVRTLQRRGFRATATGYWGGASGSRPIRAVNRVLASLSPVTMPFARSFRVIARKPA
jgi:SAM-dependent methyltransferase